VVLPTLNPFRREHGLPEARNVVTEWWHSPDRVIGLFPGWFGPPQPDWPPQARLTGFPLYEEPGELDPALEGWISDGEPPVVFTPGSAMAHGAEFFAAAVAALKLLGRRGLLLSQFPETVPRDLPPSVRHAQWAPMSKLLHRCAMLAYHGGIGTCAQALRAGVPHLVMHMAHDQWDNLSRLQDLGVGDGAKPRRFTARWIADQIDWLTGDADVRTRCREVASWFTPQEWINETCELIEQTSFNPERSQ
jgi:UDP:flavonoid glycosyltransferase YjiC (YdhE family)